MQPDVQLIERIVRLETTLELYLWFAGILLVILTGVLAALYGITQRTIRKRVEKAVERSTVGEVEKKVREQSDAATSNCAEIQVHLEAVKKLRAQGERLLQEPIAKSQQPPFFEQGRVPLRFVDTNGVKGAVEFRTEFEEPPMVWVCETGCGQWIFAKVDETTTKAFRWAAKAIFGKPVTYDSQLLWVAIGRKRSDQGHSDADGSANQSLQPTPILPGELGKPSSN